MLKDEAVIIKQAIINETEGYEFYKLAAEHARTEESKAAFETLAQEEMVHIDWLKDLYKVTANENADDFDLGFDIELPEPSIFKWNNVDRKDASLAVSVFAIGMQMERESVTFYKSAAEKTQNKKLKAIYNILVLWEKRHMAQFAEEYERLRENWWAEQDFAVM